MPLFLSVNISQIKITQSIILNGKSIINKRTMFSRVTHTTNMVSPRVIPNIVQRSYPGQYNLVRLRKNIHIISLY